MKNLEWRHLLGLYQIYSTGSTRLKILSNSFINQILVKQKKMIRFKSGNHNVLEKSPLFDSYFEKELLVTYKYYTDFFSNSNLETDARKTFSEDDLKTLIFIYNNKELLVKNLTTEYTFSARVFKQGSKYLCNKPSLKKAVLQLLNIYEFPEKDPKNNQWRFVVDCENPQVIVLCENLACLRVPFEYKAHNIELWYVGGNNTSPLLDIAQDKLKIPIYYFCDWDYNGLAIYSRIKKIIGDKGIEIKIVQPESLQGALAVNSLHHASKWKKTKFSNLNANDFTNVQIEFIEELIKSDLWIEEESMDLINLLKIDNII